MGLKVAVLGHCLDYCGLDCHISVLENIPHSRNTVALQSTLYSSSLRVTADSEVSVRDHQNTACGPHRRCFTADLSFHLT